MDKPVRVLVHNDELVDGVRVPRGRIPEKTKDDFVRLYAAGFSTNQIAEMHNVSSAAVKVTLRARNVKRRSRGSHGMAY